MVAIPFKLLNGQTFMVEVDPSFTILQVKQQVERTHGVPVAKQTMIFAGRKLKDSHTIVDLGIVSETAVMLVLPPGTVLRPGGGGGGGAAAAPAPAPAPAPAHAPPAAVPVPAPAPTPVPARAPAQVPPRAPPAVAPERKAAEEVVVAPPVDMTRRGGAPPPRAAAKATKQRAATGVAVGTPVATPTAGAGGAGAGAAPAPAAADAVVALNIKELSGTIRTINVRLNQPFREIKQELQRLTGIPVIQQRLVFRGALVNDTQTPAFYDCNNDTCMHLVRHVTRDVLAEVITKEGLRANCMFCHKAGAQFDARPLCANCFARGQNPESVMITAGDLTIGRTKWRELLSVQVQCFNCQQSGAAAIGFLCLQPQPDGHNCVSRRERRLQNTYRGTGEEELQATMNRHFGYAHAGGMEDTVARS